MDKEYNMCMCICMCMFAYTHAHMYTHTKEYYSAIKRIKFCHLQQHGWTKKWFTLSEMGESTYDSTYIWNLENKTNEQT